MTKSVFSSFFFFFFTVALLLILAAASASAGNTTSGLRYSGCSPGDTVGECITATDEEEEEEEGVEAVVRRILQQGGKLSYKGLGKQPTCNAKIYGDCIRSVHGKSRPCTYYNKCKRATH